MLMTQRLSSLSLDFQEGMISSQSALIPFLTYSLYFPALLGGPLCSFNAFVRSVERRQTSMSSYLGNLTSKILQVIVLVWIKHLFGELLKLVTFSIDSSCVCLDVLWIWMFSLILRLNYYAHWKMSECVNNAAGLGVYYHKHSGQTLWDGLSDGSVLVTEASSRASTFARKWNQTTADWLRKMVFNRTTRSPLFMTFGFSALWHGLHPGQILGFLIWAVTVQADYKLHRFLHPMLNSMWRKRLYVCVNWVFTQLTVSCVVFCVEFQSLASVKLLWSSCIAVFPLLSALIIIIL